MHKVLRLQVPETYDLPEVVELFHKAFDYDFAADGEEARLYLQKNCDSPENIVLMVSDGVELTGLSFTWNGYSPFATEPQVVYFWAPQDTESKLAMGGEIIRLLRESGRLRIQALNLSVLEDSGYLETFSQLAPGAVTGSVVEFMVGTDERTELEEHEQQ